MTQTYTRGFTEEEKNVSQILLCVSTENNDAESQINSGLVFNGVRPQPLLEALV